MMIACVCVCVCTFLTSLCERLVSSVLDATEKLTTIHAVKDKQAKQEKTWFLQIKGQM